MAAIIIVPTSHIAKESIRAVEEVIGRVVPDCVAVELDINRFMAMEGSEASAWQALKRLGPWTFLMFIVLKKLQSWLGRKAGIMPGSDMLMAVRAAEQQGIHVEFIDRDITITLGRLKGIAWKEKVRLLLFVLKGLTLDSMLTKTGRGKNVMIDIKKVPPKEIIEEVIATLKTEFPGIYSALVAERDAYMARRLAVLATRFGKTVAVVGAAHATGLERILNEAGCKNQNP